jgi:hypothetical protein
MRKKYSITVFFIENNKKPRKYRNISNLISFTSFVKKSGGIYYNMYDQETKIYIKRIYIKKAGE